MVMQILRAETHPQHESLEKRLQITEIAGNADRYRRLLKSFYGFYREYEPRILQWQGRATEALRLGDRIKLPMLGSDLEALGCDLSELDSIPDCKCVPACQTLAETLGALYVTEGATLGGQVIRRIFASAGRSVMPVAFFDCYGADTGRRWREFGLFAEAFADNDTLRLQMVQSARETFACLEHALCGEEVSA